ncbi:HNH homing endonuclease [Psychroflexus torquis ATCC 700755]|uniref:HNH homing endonuclease n=1 Tax=Psychroflexus torquis (strain ATCC 700755 / CIP 106069 / ACAM 623) TaxID=313595 RepID=K4IC71_PSYTT|nr:HNH endonuclease [Psychroflexus torquis]AFU68212.1 HNH homing endonuclease [Psychroflexus torquis ATCC 700755]
MIRNYWNEQWKPMVFDEKIANTEKYKISNYGRLIKCQAFSEVLVNEFFINGYQTIPLKQKENGKSTSRYVHKLVAQHFLEQGDGIYVIHLNYDKKDNKVENLKWATKKEKENHQFTNPEYLNRPKKRTYSKLTEAKVRLIKRKIHDPNRRTRMKMIAKQFGISEMQLYRIKSGENWGTVTDY